ncbi:glutaredoxin family protein [Rubrivivax albus]|uniref:Glutaredoxin family protein n=1 Tax=Rubrivivax albus TaxID=2499835 RepID=A0A3S2UB94_9BURK|nr:glutaredoxin family protein [Rubrivivax albus]RVT54123.1 glutaredoxin family protein [Rubrivivax albus]
MNVSRRSLFGLVLLILAISVASQWWGHRQEAQVGERLAALVRPGDLKMIASDTCGICSVARTWLRDHGVAFEECSIERDAACRAEFEALRAAGTPVFVVAGQQASLGFSPSRLLAQVRALRSG